MALSSDIKKLTNGSDPIAPFRTIENLTTIRTVEGLADAMNQKHAGSVKDTTRLATAIWLGAAWRYGEAKKLITKGNAEEFAKLLNYSTVHFRLCARLWDDRDIIDSAAAWFLDNKAQITVQPRKAEGIEWQVVANRVYKAFQKALSDTKSEEAAFAKVNADLGPKADAPGPRISMKHIQRRYYRLLVGALEALGTANPDNPLVKRWRTPAEMLEWIETEMYGEDEEQQFIDAASQQDMPFVPEAHVEPEASAEPTSPVEQISGRNKPSTRKQAA